MKIMLFVVLTMAAVQTSNQTPDPQSGLPETVSLVELIANPAQYDGRAVLVIGFLHLEFEGNELYLHQQDYEEHISKNGIWVDATKEFQGCSGGLNDHYVLMAGLFSARRKGHRSMASGAIAVDRAMTWPRRSGTPLEECKAD